MAHRLIILLFTFYYMLKISQVCANFLISIIMLWIGYWKHIMCSDVSKVWLKCSKIFQKNPWGYPGRLLSKMWSFWESWEFSSPFLGMVKTIQQVSIKNSNLWNLKFSNNWFHLILDQNFEKSRKAFSEFGNECNRFLALKNPPNRVIFTHFSCRGQIFCTSEHMCKKSNA